MTNGRDQDLFVGAITRSNNNVFDSPRISWLVIREMSSARVGTRLTVVTPEGEVMDIVIKILEPPTALGVAVVRCERCGLVVIIDKLGYQLPSSE